MELYDIEIEMHVFRMLRSGLYSRAKDVLHDVALEFPEQPIERLRNCCARLAERLLKDSPH